MLTTEDKMKICARCKNRKFELRRGLVCSLTDQKPQFDDKCDSFIVDETVLMEEQRREQYENFEDTSPVDGPDTDASFNAPWWVWVLVALAAVWFFVKFYNEHTKEPERLTVSEILKPTLASINRTLPKKFPNGEVWTKISLEGKVLIYDILTNSDLSRLEGKELELSMMAAKHAWLSDYNSVTNFDAIDFHEAIKDYKLQVAYRYSDQNGYSIPLIHVTEQELRRAVSSKKYKCPVEDIKAIVDYYNTWLPMPYADGGSLEEITFSEDTHELSYINHLPFDDNQMKYFSKNDFDKHIKGEWSNLIDSVIILAMINEYPVTFVFCSNNGTEYHRVTVGPDQYKKWRNQ